MRTVEKLIEQKKKEIEKLAQEISDLTDKELFGSKNFVVKDEVIEVIKVKTGRKKSDIKEINIKEGRRMWTEDFVDEDTGEVVSIERSEVAAINGKRVDKLFRPVKIIARLVEVSSDKKAWE